MLTSQARRRLFAYTVRHNARCVALWQENARRNTEAAAFWAEAERQARRRSRLRPFRLRCLSVARRREVLDNLYL